MREGYIRLNRKLLEWEWFTDGNTLVVWIYILLNANWKDKRFRGKVIKRGQLLTTTTEMGAQLNLTRQNIRTALNHLEETGEISTNKSTKYGTLITVEKYDLYQCDEDEANQPTNHLLTNCQPTNRRKREKDIYINNINNTTTLLNILSEEQLDNLLYRVGEEDHKALMDELSEINGEGIKNAYSYAVKVAKKIGVYR